MLVMLLQPVDSLIVEDLTEDTVEELVSGQFSPGVWFLTTRDSRHDFPAPWGQQIRAKGQGQRWETALTLDRDPGEPRVVDQSTGYASYRASAISVLLGDFRFSSGAGFVSAPPRFGAPVSSTGRAVRASGFRGYAGTTADSYLRGLALAASRGGFLILGWASRRPLDGFMDSTGVSVSSNGVRRTETQISRRNELRASTRGGAITWRSFGITGATERIGHLRETAVEAFGTVSLGQARLQAALARCRCRFATSTSALASLRVAAPRRGPSASILFRRVGKTPRTGNPLVTMSGGETGYTMLISIPLGGVRILGATDHAWRPDGSRRAERLTIRRRASYLLLERRHATSRGIVPSTSGPLIGQAVIPQRIARISVLLPGAPKTRLEAGSLRRNAIWSWLLRASTSANVGRYRIEVGLAEFRALAGSAPLVVYEPAPRHAFPLARLSGSGRRVHLGWRATRGPAMIHVFGAWQHGRPVTALDKPDNRLQLTLSLGTT